MQLRVVGAGLPRTGLRNDLTRLTDGWTPLCRRLDVPEPVEGFPRLSRRGQWR
ncbi:MAG: hypothetical protein H0T66_07025 [Geodermatophilaceae bacterium]|nr:hypothetical protein [Geodermatophilaceae bacterium]MDQ3455064.1 hypothetical protein [Actinomycetota bacterium]